MGASRSLSVYQVLFTLSRTPLDRWDRERVRLRRAKRWLKLMSMFA